MHPLPRAGIPCYVKKSFVAARGLGIQSEDTACLTFGREEGSLVSGLKTADLALRAKENL